jgi:hypothetical protein
MGIALAAWPRPSAKSSTVCGLRIVSSRFEREILSPGPLGRGTRSRLSVRVRAREPDHSSCGHSNAACYLQRDCALSQRALSRRAKVNGLLMERAGSKGAYGTPRIHAELQASQFT